MILLRLLFFLSGAAGLIYEVLWTRILSDVVGSTSLAMTGVFSVFLASLALGAWIFGTLPWQGKRAVMVYGVMELAVAALAGLSTWLILEWGSWIATLGPAGGGFLWELGVALGVSILAVTPATLLMGGTLPVILNGAAPLAPPRREAPILYGVNTLGAALGTLAAGFVLIWLLGLRGTVLVALGLNLTAGSVALLSFPWLFAEEDERSGKGGAPGEAPQLAPAATSREQTDPFVPQESNAGCGLWPEAGVLPTPPRKALAFFSGFLILGYEILWGRMARFILGDRTLAIAALLFVVISALGAGSILAPRISRRLMGPWRESGFLAWLLLLGCLLTLGMVWVGTGWATDAIVHGEPMGTLSRLGGIWALLFPPLLLLGMVFPLLILGFRAVDRGPGRAVGSLYLWNTLGAVVGAVTASFLLSAWVGTLGGFYLLSGVASLVGLVLLGTSGARGRSWIPAGTIGIVVLLAPFFLPGNLAPVRPDETLVEVEEDAYGVQVLVRTESGYTRVRNNRVSLVFDLGHPDTDHAQQMAAHWAMLLADQPRNVLNVGTGYGITAGAFTLYPSLVSLETVEILPFLVERQGAFGEHNFQHVTDPRVRLIQGDGRHHLLASEGTYDIISVNVLDPYLPGSASLYTTDFWMEARDRLNPGGVFTQLFWGADLGLLVKGILKVFPTVLYFPAYGGSSLNVVAFRDPVGPESLTLHLERLRGPAMREVTRLEGSPETALPRLVARGWRRAGELQALARATSGPLHTDDRPVLEYRWTHGTRGVSPLDSPLVQY